MIQSFREQAERAERLARSINDQQTYDALLNYARECREKDAMRLGPVRAGWTATGTVFI
jgi:hypothetical protein